MKLSQVKALLPTLENLTFKLEIGSFVPEHFHVTEVGMITKNFIDCGGVIRSEKTVNFQLWNADDFEHRLKPTKLLHIIQLSEEKLGMEDAEIEVEYQSEIEDSQSQNGQLKKSLQTIGKYSLAFDGTHFILQNKTTACLAPDACGIPSEKVKKNLSELTVNQSTSCAPGGGCC